MSYKVQQLVALYRTPESMAACQMAPIRSNARIGLSKNTAFTKEIIGVYFEVGRFNTLTISDSLIDQYATLAQAES